MERLSHNIAHAGVQGVYKHRAASTDCDMTFSVFVPDGDGPFPVLWYLSGLTCTHANVMEKGEYRAACAKYGIIFVAPDTSPRGENIPDEDAYDFGQGAGFYVDATLAPYDKNYQMRRYIEQELPALIAANFPADMTRQGIMGHSMGGHGALTIGLRNPDIYKSISAFAPIVSPINCLWGQKALSAYIGTDQNAWRQYDACALIDDGARVDALFIDQGLADNFLSNQLKPELIEKACANSGINVNLRRHEGYDHSYYFISTFMADHIAWHAKRLTA